MTQLEQLEALLELVRNGQYDESEYQYDLIQSAMNYGTEHVPVATFINAWRGSVDLALQALDMLKWNWDVDDLSQNSSQAGSPWGCKLVFYRPQMPTDRSAWSQYDFDKKPGQAMIVAIVRAKIIEVTA